MERGGKQDGEEDRERDDGPRCRIMTLLLTISGMACPCHGSKAFKMLIGHNRIRV
jgi:hypothetical protein